MARMAKRLGYAEVIRINAAVFRQVFHAARVVKSSMQNRRAVFSPFVREQGYVVIIKHIISIIDIDHSTT